MLGSVFAMTAADAQPAHVWCYVTIFKHAMLDYITIENRHLQFSGVPQYRWTRVPAYLGDRLDKGEDEFLYMQDFANERYTLFCRDGDKLAFSGTLIQDNLLVEKRQIRYIMVAVSVTVGDNVAVVKATFASGEEVKPDGWKVNLNETIMPKTLVDAIWDHSGDDWGPEVEVILLKEGEHTPVDFEVPLYTPRCS